MVAATGVQVMFAGGATVAVARPRTLRVEHQHRPGQPGPQRATVCFPARGSTRSSNATRSSPGSR
jgi:hypothetical protein